METDFRPAYLNIIFILLLSSCAHRPTGVGEPIPCFEGSGKGRVIWHSNSARFSFDADIIKEEEEFDHWRVYIRIPLKGEEWFQYRRGKGKYGVSSSFLDGSSAQPWSNGKDIAEFLTHLFDSFFDPETLNVYENVSQCKEIKEKFCLVDTKTKSGFTRALYRDLTTYWEKKVLFSAPHMPDFYRNWSVIILDSRGRKEGQLSFSFSRCYTKRKQ